MNKRRIVLILLLLLGAFIVIFHDRLIDQYDELFQPPDPRKVIATLESFDGSVNYKKPKTLRFRKVRPELALRDQDTLVTADGATAILTFEGGYKLEVEPNSIVVIEEPQVGEDGSVRVTFLRGDYRVIDTGSISGKLLIAKDQNVIDAAGRPAPPKPLQIAMREPEKPPPPPPPPIKSEVVEELKKEIKKAPVAPPKKRETLPDEYITSIVKRETPSFNRCYAQHLRLNPNARGRINLSFTIANTGRVTTVRLLGSTFKDARLEQCVMAVVERTRFRTYEGDPVIVNYPINFE